MEKRKENIYVVLRYSGSTMSKILRAITKDEFTHVSLSFDPTLNEMYSFARRSKYIPFCGGFGFTQESKDNGILKRYKDSKIQVLKLQADPEKLAKLKETIKDMYVNEKQYKYSFKGLIMAYFKKEYLRDYYYYCSEFVKKVLIEHEIIKDNVLPQVARPIDFQKIEEKEVVYTGRMDEYEPEIY